MTPIGQHFHIHYIYSPLWLWNIEHLKNSPRKTKTGHDLTCTFRITQEFHLICYHWTLKRKESQISALVSQHPSCAHAVPCLITPREWLSRCEGCGWDWIRRLQRVPVSLDDWCLLCFSSICAAPVDRAPPHLLPNISCLFFHSKPRASPTASPPGQSGSWESLL